MKTPEEFAKDCESWDVSYPQLVSMFRLIWTEGFNRGYKHGKFEGYNDCIEISTNNQDIEVMESARDTIYE